MSDERTAEPAPGTPGQRALGAMESAVRRARESAGGPPLPTSPPLGPQPPTRTVGAAPPREERRPPVPPERTRPPAPSGASPPPARPDRWLMGTVAVVAVLVGA